MWSAHNYYDLWQQSGYMWQTELVERPKGDNLYLYEREFDNIWKISKYLSGSTLLNFVSQGTLGMQSLREEKAALIDWVRRRSFLFEPTYVKQDVNVAVV